VAGFERTCRPPQLRVLYGHTALIYSLAATADGLVASGSEDSSAKVWRAETGECLQSIEHPGCVWDVAFLRSGDLATGCSDANVRVWTTADERKVGLAGRGGGLAKGSAGRVLPRWMGALYGVEPGGQAHAAGRSAGLCPLLHHGCCCCRRRRRRRRRRCCCCCCQPYRTHPLLPPPGPCDPPPQADAQEAAAYQAVMDARKAEAAASASAAASDPASSLPAGVKVEDPASLAEPGRKDGETRVSVLVRRACGCLCGRARQRCPAVLLLLLALLALLALPELQEVVVQRGQGPPSWAGSGPDADAAAAGHPRA
jgi:hypothetical protein